jgi:aminoglycoside phosphotransferase family enzyme/predicted kinase
VSQALIAALQNPALYPHPVDGFSVVETHISWVVLTGHYAYKIKKAVNFGFLDFSTLEARQHFCQEELRLNQRLTKGLYLDVLPISGSAQSPNFDAQGPVFEYALKMRQFPQEQLLAQVHARGELSPEHIDALAQQIADFHQSTPQVALDHPLCNAAAMVAPLEENFEQIRPMLSDSSDLKQLEGLHDWFNSSLQRLRPVLARRAAEGFIRECHGDIHLGNATLLDGVATLFDCIEFNEAFRLTDIALDIAFLIMDLEDRGLKCLAHRLLNAWLERTGDYASLPLLNLYKTHRALVRAKVALFRLAQEQDAVQRAVILRQYRSYVNLAESYSAIPTRLLAITHGVSAVGKSHVALRLVEALGFIRVRSDVERKRLHAEQQRATPERKADLYSEDASQATYEQLRQLAALVLQAGYPVVLDATFLKAPQRQAARWIAEQSGVPFLIIDCQAPASQIARWLELRQQQAQDPSDATLQVIEAQHASQDALSEGEQSCSKRVDTQDSHSLNSLIASIRHHFLPNP